MKRNIIIILIFSLLFGCTKKKIDYCEPFPIFKENALWGVIYYKKTSHRSVSFNPNNPNEIALLETSPSHTIDSSSTTSIIKYNFKTKEKTILLDNNRRIYSGPKWNKNGWLFFNMQKEWGTSYIWKMKANGDSLTQLPTWYKSGHPFLNKEGDKILYFRGDHLPRISIIIDINGQPIDSVSTDMFSSLVYGVSWQHDSLIIGGGYRDLVILDPVVDSIRLLEELNPDEANGGGTIWLDSVSIIWSNAYGVHRYNTITKESFMIKPNYYTKMHFINSYSPEIKKVLLTRVDRKITDTDKGVGEVSTQIIMMNIDGTDEEVIIIPES